MFVAICIIIIIFITVIIIIISSSRSSSSSISDLAGEGPAPLVEERGLDEQARDEVGVLV